jgi:hypothetical protein
MLTNLCGYKSRHFFEPGPAISGDSWGPGFFEALGAIRVLNARPLQLPHPPPPPLRPLAYLL